jgi:hypothetical protein
MTKTSKRKIAVTAFAAAMMGSAAFAGGLFVEVGNPEANPEAKSVNAVLVARVTACHEPAKSTLTAHSVQMVNGEIQRTPLTVAPLKTPGTFAIIGSVPRGSAIDLAVTNPEYKNYQPRVLIRTDAQGIRWASAKRFFSIPPTENDIRSVLGVVD